MIVIDELLHRFFAPHASPAGAGTEDSPPFPGRWLPPTVTAPAARPVRQRGRIAGLLDGMFGHANAVALPKPMAPDECGAVVRLIGGLIRGGRYEDARRMLDLCLERCPGHAPFLNLAGAVCEAEKDWRKARRYYGGAIAADRCSADAQQNMRRVFELFTWGASREPIALGDESADGRIPVLHEFPEECPGYAATQRVCGGAATGDSQEGTESGAVI